MKTTPLIVECCVCRRVRAGDEWREETRSLQRVGRVSHAYCPECLDRVMGELDLLLGKEASANSRAVAG